MTTKGTRIWKQYDRDRGPIAALSCNDPSRTKQSFKTECDINNLMARYTSSGLLPQGTTRTPVYGDFTTFDDYFHAVNIINHAQEHFDSLPAEARKRFANDPAELLLFLEDTRNRQEAINLGLIDKPPEPPAPPPETKP